MRLNALQANISRIAAALFAVCVAAGVAGSVAAQNPMPAAAGGLIGLYLLFAIRVADQWEKVAVLRFGRYIGLLGRELQSILDGKTNPWGVTVQSVEIRDVQIPNELQDAILRQAQAERERQARIILGQAETEISETFSLAAATYQDNPVALHLRAMNMLYEAIKKRGSMVIVPSSAVETMGLGGSLATASLAGAKHQ